MSRSKLVIAALLLLIILILPGLLFWSKRSRPTKPQTTYQPSKPVKIVKSKPPAKVDTLPLDRQLPGDRVLLNYASPSQAPLKDIQQIQEVTANALRLVKNRDLREYATNEDLAEFLRGKNRYKQVMISANNPVFDAEGRLIDRWGTPLVVHPVSEGNLEIFSAGPDQIPWNEDDVGQRTRY